MSLDYRPLHDRILVCVERNNREEKSPGGILIPQIVHNKYEYGTIVAVGPGRITESGVRLPMESKVGDRVVLNKYTGHEIPFQDQVYVIVTDKDVLAVVEERKA